MPVDDELRKRVDKKFAKVARQVSELADMEVELMEERNPSITRVAGGRGSPSISRASRSGRARRSEDMVHSINLAAEDLARQVKRHREKRRKRREAHRASPRDRLTARLAR